MHSQDFFIYNRFLPEVISTVDHVFSSPPIRLIDSHLQLADQNAVFFVHDTNFPNPKRYRTELQIDSGIYSEKKSTYCIFDHKKMYSSQSPIYFDAKKQIHNLKLVLKSNLFDFTEYQQEIYADRFLNIYNLYLECIEEKVAWKFHRKYLSKVYEIIGLNKLSHTITNKMVNFFDSVDYINFLMDLIIKTHDKDYGIKNLLRHKVFQKTLFRNSKVNETNLINNINYIKQSLINKEIIPSYEIYLWSFFLADIKHFGNDLGFTDRLKKILPHCEYLQITQEKFDGTNFIKFYDNFSFGLSHDVAKMRLKNTKPTRLGNIVSIYLHLGELHMMEKIEDYIKYKKEALISMKEINV